MAKITIIIQGIAISYHKNDGLWKILFPFGDFHMVEFKERSSSDGISLAQSGCNIRITTANAQSSFEAGDDYRDFLDLTDEYSHSSGVKLKQDWQDRAVLMSVENARFLVHKYTDYEHFMLRDTNVTSVPKKIAYSGKFEIEAESIAVYVDDHPEFPKVFDDVCTLVFDNDCHDDTPKTTSDFVMVYNVIEDVEDPALQFTVDTIPSNSYERIYPGAIRASQTDKVCYRDPVNKGLPCHIVKISKSVELP